MREFRPPITRGAPESPSSSAPSHSGSPFERTPSHTNTHLTTRCEFRAVVQVHGLFTTILRWTLCQTARVEFDSSTDHLDTPTSAVPAPAPSPRKVD